MLAANTAGTSITASYNAATETLTLTGSDTFAHYQQVLDWVTFVTASENPDDFGSAPTRTVTWTLNDGGAASSVTTAVSITAANDAPTLSGTTNASFTENGPPVTLSRSASVADPDSQTLAGATVALTGGTFAGDGDVLAANTAGTAITASYNAATETLVLSGSDTLAHYQQVLDSVTFVTGERESGQRRRGTDPHRDLDAQRRQREQRDHRRDHDREHHGGERFPDTLRHHQRVLHRERACGDPVGAAAVTDPDNATLAGATVALTGGTFAGDGDVLAANTAGTGSRRATTPRPRHWCCRAPTHWRITSRCSIR